jgi:DNA repair photolyase
MQYLDELDERGYRYYFQFTLTGYLTIIEPFVPPMNSLISSFRELSGRVGPDRVVWRFDPVLVSDITDEGTILETFGHIADRIDGCAQRVVISFAHFYRSVAHSLSRLEKAARMRFYDVTGDEPAMRRIAASMAEVAHGHAMEIASCAVKLDLTGQGIARGKCIDDVLIKRVFGITVPVGKDPYQRAECGCIRSQDIGQYNTCVHDCIYCYANSNKRQAHLQKLAHDPESSFLIAGPGDPGSPENRRFGGDLFSSAGNANGSKTDDNGPH